MAPPAAKKAGKGLLALMPLRCARLSLANTGVRAPNSLVCLQ